MSDYEGILHVLVKLLSLQLLSSCTSTLHADTHFNCFTCAVVSFDRLVHVPTMLV